jgi:hypothetical protein
MMDEGEVISVTMPLLDHDAAEKLVDSGKIIYSMLNYLALNPQITLDIFPTQERFSQIADQEGISIPEVKQEFIRNHRAALIAIAYCGKVVLNQVAEHFDLGHTFDLTPDNMLMEQFSKDYAERHKPDFFDLETALREVEAIMGNDKEAN